jgi:hypothetical protein
LMDFPLTFNSESSVFNASQPGIGS